METAAVDVIAEVSLSLRVLIIRNVTKTIACQASTISSVPSDSLLTPTLYNVHNPEHDIQHAFLYYRKQELPSQVSRVVWRRSDRLCKDCFRA